MPFKFNPFTGNLDIVNASLTNPLQFQGSIAVATDFPTLAAVQNGWFYRVTASVTDNNATRTNTGQSFVSGDEIVWNGTNWTNLGNENIYVPYTGATADLNLGTHDLYVDEVKNGGNYVVLDATNYRLKSPATGSASIDFFFGKLYSPITGAERFDWTDMIAPVTLKLQNADALELGKDDTSNTAGKVKLWSAGSNSYYTTIATKTQTANANYTLPTSQPSASAFLKSTSAGSLAWDTSTYLTTESDTLQSVTDRGSDTTTGATFGGDVGIGTTTPRGIFDVNKLTTYTIADVTTPDATIYPSYGGGNATANGYTWTYYVYAYRTVNGTQIFSTNPLQFTFTDDGSTNQMAYSFSWDAVANADGYRIIVMEDNQYGAYGDYYTDIPAIYTGAVYYQDDTDGYESNSGTYYNYGNTVTPNSVNAGSDLYIDSNTGRLISLGDIEANSFIKTSGTSAQFLKADGSIDSTAYMPLPSLTSGYLPYWTGSGLSNSPFYTAGGKAYIGTTSGSSLLTINSGSTLTQAFEVTGTNFVRFAVNNTLASGSGSSYSIASFNCQSTTHYFQFATYGNGTNNGSRWGASLNGVTELMMVNLTGAVKMVLGTYNSIPIVVGINQAEVARWDTSGHFNLSEGKNVILGTTTGTKLGTATNQKIGFFNSTPIIQPIATLDLGTVLSNLGLRAAGTAYPITTSGAVNFTGGVTIATTNLTITDKDIVLSATTGTKIGTATTQKLSFYNATPIVQPTAMTTQLTDLTYTAPSTPDYAIQDLTQTSPYGFVTKDEGNTVLSVIKNLQTRVSELETKIKALGLIA